MSKSQGATHPGQKKRGPSGLNAVTTYKQIAERTGWSERTVFNLCKSAINKLQNTPGAFEGLLFCVWAVNAEERDPLQACSVECRKDFVATFTKSPSASYDTGSNWGGYDD
jgi:hypothetical protein